MSEVELVKIDGIEVGVEMPPYFISPDMEKGMDYYSIYLDKAVLAGKRVLDPASYFNQILAKVGDTGKRRDEIVKHYSKHVGSTRVIEQMEKAWYTYNKAKEMPLLVRVTNKKQEQKLYTIAQIKFIIEDQLKKGESLMLEPVEFIHETTTK